MQAVCGVEGCFAPGASPSRRFPSAGKARSDPSTMRLPSQSIGTSPTDGPAKRHTRYNASSCGGYLQRSSVPSGAYDERARKLVGDESPHMYRASALVGGPLLRTSLKKACGSLPPALARRCVHHNYVHHTMWDPSKKPTAGMNLVIHGDSTNFPINGQSNRQDCARHSTPEAEISAADVALRRKGVPALEMWDVLAPGDGLLISHEDNEAMLRVCRTGKNPTMHDLLRSHAVGIGDRIYKPHTIRYTARPMRRTRAAASKCRLMAEQNEPPPDRHPSTPMEGLTCRCSTTETYLNQDGAPAASGSACACRRRGTSPAARFRACRRARRRTAPRPRRGRGSSRTARRPSW